MFAIVEELRSGPPSGRTAAWLAERFEVSDRTIKRDVSALQQADVPIWATPGPGGGYALDPAATLPPLTFTPGEAAAMATALAALPDLPFAPDGRSALTKVLGAMSEQGRQSVGDLGGRIWVRPGEGGAKPEVSRVLDEAMRSGVVVVLDYVDADGNTTEKRPVEPMAYANTGRHWQLMAWCRRRRAGRWFRLDRVQAAHLTTERFAQRDLTETFGDPPDDATNLHLGHPASGRSSG
jgi:predicted DNA-binding transcriptional regulator YafY